MLKTGSGCIIYGCIEAFGRPFSGVQSDCFPPRRVPAAVRGRLPTRTSIPQTREARTRRRNATQLRQDGAAGRGPAPLPGGVHPGGRAHGPALRLQHVRGFLQRPRDAAAGPFPRGGDLFRGRADRRHHRQVRPGPATGRTGSRHRRRRCRRHPGLRHGRRGQRRPAGPRRGRPALRGPAPAGRDQPRGDRRRRGPALHLLRGCRRQPARRERTVPLHSPGRQPDDRHPAQAAAQGREVEHPPRPGADPRGSTGS